MPIEKEKARSNHDEVTVDTNSGSLSIVYDFGGESSLPPPPTLSEAEERKLYRKIDVRLMPILALLYLLSFIDRGESYCVLFRFVCSRGSTLGTWYSTGNIGTHAASLSVMRSFRVISHVTVYLDVGTVRNILTQWLFPPTIEKVNIIFKTFLLDMLSLSPLNTLDYVWKKRIPAMAEIGNAIAGMCVDRTRYPYLRHIRIQVLMEFEESDEIRQTADADTLVPKIIRYQPFHWVLCGYYACDNFRLMRVAHHDFIRCTGY
ncbi:hypothetical protein DXG03_003445 [Asterophora parasitica]|uniref:Uncharacterized protein n=1 Tax=Asterophora parasitica TaxID=117018 RepID=A0A9P7G143_9AGAR|nr:hypothetical protein DXG03_003445 [Asterophora parasitica]